MGIKTFNPYTPSRRQMTALDKKDITKKTPEKSLLAVSKKNSGRNNQGKITVRHRGGGTRKQYRIIDFKRNKDGIPAKVAGIEYDPNRTANIALLHYADGEKAYIIAPLGLKDGMTVMSGPNAEVRVGNCLPLENIPIGTEIHNIELYPGKGGQLVRSAGNAAQLMAKEGKYATLRLPSGEMRMVPIICRATIGQVGNVEHDLDLAALGGMPGQSEAALPVGNVAGEGFRLSAGLPQLLDCIFQLADRAAAEDRVVALGCHTVGGGQAHAGAASGDDAHFLSVLFHV